MVKDNQCASINRTNCRKLSAVVDREVPFFQASLFPPLFCRSLNLRLRLDGALKSLDVEKPVHDGAEHAVQRGAAEGREVDEAEVPHVALPNESPVQEG